jgi:peptide/nickel transport system permease protein
MPHPEGAFPALAVPGGAVGRARSGRRFKLGSWLAAAWIAVVLLAAVLQPVLPLGESKDTAATLRDPRFLTPDLFSAHPLGTNNYGLDLLARVVEGARLSLTVAVSASVIGLVIGGTIGVVTGYRRGAVEAVVGILTDVVLAFPALVLLLAIATVVEPTRITLSLSLAFLTVPTYIRMARANTITVVQRDYVQAARSMGAGDGRIIATEVVPNVMLPLLSYALVSLSVLIVAEAALSFLGLGITPPDPTWGNMIAEGNGGTAEKHPHIVLVPGAVLFLVVLSLNLLGEKARQRWDPVRRVS